MVNFHFDKRPANCHFVNPFLKNNMLGAKTKEINKLLDEKATLLKQIREVDKEIRAMKCERTFFKKFPAFTERGGITSSMKSNSRLTESALNSTKFNGYHLFSFTKHVCANNVVKYGARGRTEYIDFKYKLHIVEDKQVTHLDLKFKEAVLEAALGKWRKKLLKKKDFHGLLHGIVQYSELLKRMNSLVRWLFEEHNDLFELKKSDVQGCIIESKMINEGSVAAVVIEWKITWNDCENLMFDSFHITVPDIKTFRSDILDTWKIFAGHTSFTHHDIKNFWSSVIEELQHCK